MSTQTLISAVATAPPLASPYTPPATPPSPPMATQPVTTGVPCPLCPQAFALSSEWTRHVDWVHSREDCGVCGKVLQGRQNATFHLQECHSHGVKDVKAARHPCPVCPPAAAGEFHYENGLVKHLLERHMKRGCGVCGLTVPATGGGGDAAERMVRHIKQNHYPARGDNEEGDGDSDDEDEDDDDSERHAVPVLEEPPPMYQCLLCGRGSSSRIFSSEEMLRDHQRQQHDVFFCKTCGDTVTSSHEYREHQKSKHPLMERTNNVDTANGKQFLAPGPPPKVKKLKTSNGSSVLSNFGPLLPGTVSTFPAMPLSVSNAISAITGGAVAEDGSPLAPPPPVRRFSCPRCAYQATQKTNLLRHFEAFHITFRCRICSELQMSRKNVVDHVRKAHASLDDRYDVKDAHFETDRAVWKEIHRSGEDNGGAGGEQRSNYGCPSCSFKSNSYNKWLKHQCRGGEGFVGATTLPGKGRLYQCPYCQMACPSGAEVAEHMTKSHGVVARFSPSQKRGASSLLQQPGSENSSPDASVFKVPRLSAKKKFRKRDDSFSEVSSPLPQGGDNNGDRSGGSDTDSLGDDGEGGPTASSFASRINDADGAASSGSTTTTTGNFDIRTYLRRECDKFRLQCEAEAYAEELTYADPARWDDCFSQAVAQTVSGGEPVSAVEMPHVDLLSVGSAAAAYDADAEEMDGFDGDLFNGCV